MTFPEFDQLFDELISECRHMRDTKGKEYANNQADRLANFKDIANELGIVTIGDVRRAFTDVSNRFQGEPSEFINAFVTELKPNPKAVLLVYMMKHVRSIEAWVKYGEVSSNERIKGRIVDLITYAALLWGLENDSPADQGFKDVLKAVYCPQEPKDNECYDFVGDVPPLF